MFKHSFDNLKEKLELSKDLNIPFSNYMLSSISDNIKQIVNYIKKNNLNFNEIMYSKNIKYLKY